MIATNHCFEGILRHFYSNRSCIARDRLHPLYRRCSRSFKWAGLVLIRIRENKIAKTSSNEFPRKFYPAKLSSYTVYNYTCRLGLCLPLLTHPIPFHQPLRYLHYFFTSNRFSCVHVFCVTDFRLCTPHALMRYVACMGMTVIFAMETCCTSEADNSLIVHLSCGYTHVPMFEWIFCYNSSNIYIFLAARLIVLQSVHSYKWVYILGWTVKLSLSVLNHNVLVQGNSLGKPPPTHTPTHV